MKLKLFGLAAIAATACMASAAGTAAGTTLDVGGTPAHGVQIFAAVSGGGSSVLARTDGSLANTCTTVFLAAETETSHTTKPTGRVTSMGLGNCERTVTVHKTGKLYVEHSGGLNGIVFSEETEVTNSTPFGTVTCKTGVGTYIGLLTGATSGNTTLHINAVLNCGFLLPSASWKGTYTVTQPQGLAVTP